MSSSRSANGCASRIVIRDAIFVCIHFNSATRAGANGIETYYYSNQSAALAANIHRQVVAGTTTDNRGIRRRGYYVLRRTAIPAVLVECGFLTNPTKRGSRCKAVIASGWPIKSPPASWANPLRPTGRSWPG